MSYKTPTYVQSQLGAGTGASASVSLLASSTVGNALVLSVHWQNDVTISAVSGGSNVWQSVSSRKGSGPYVQIWYALGALATTDITITFSGSTSWAAAAHEYGNVAKIGALEDEESDTEESVTTLEVAFLSTAQPALLFVAFTASTTVSVSNFGLANNRASGNFAWTSDTLTASAGQHSATASWRTTPADAVGQIIALTAELTGTSLDSHHYLKLEIGGTDYVSYVRGPIMVTQPLGGEIGTMRFTLAAQGSALSISSWQECRLYVDTLATCYFGGYVLNVAPTIDQEQPAGWEGYDVLVEEWSTVLNRTLPVSRRYTSGTNPGDIVADLFNYALDPTGSPPAQTEFDVTTHVSAGSWGSSAPVFLVDNEQITEALDRLALAVGFDWWIDGDKKVYFGALTSTPAPFSIAAVGAANYSTSFPPLSKPAVRRDGSDIRNRVTVYGGVQIKKYDDTLAGEGATTLFQLTKFPIIDVIFLTVDGVLQTWGTDWYHSFDDYDVLVDYACGTIRWNVGNAPANGAVILIGYYYGDQVEETVYNTELPTSYSVYGRWLDYEVVDRSITNEDMARVVAQAMVNEYEWEAVDGNIQIEKFGIEPGQGLTIILPALGLNASYTVRQVTTEFVRGGIARCEIAFGGRRRPLGVTMEGTVQAGPLGKSTTWREKLLMASLHPTATKAQGELMRSIGQTETDQLAANTDYLGSAQTVYRWPIHTKAGALAGYVPLYDDATWGPDGNVDGVHNVKAYGAVADADGAGNGTDNSSAIQDAIDAAGGGIVYLPPGGYKITTSLDLTGLASGITLRGDARETTVLYWHAAGGNVLDLTGSQYVKIENLTIVAGYFSDSGINYYADCGILMGRMSGAGSAGNHVLRDIHLNNYFRKAGIYSLSSEVNHFDNIHIYNRYAAACYHHSDTNDLSAVSAYRTLTALAANATTTTIVGGSWCNWSETGGHLAYIKNTTGLTINGLALQTDGTPATGAIVFDGTVASASLTGIRQEGTPKYGIHLKNSGSVLTLVTIFGCYFTATDALLYGDTGTTMQYSTLLGTFNTGVAEQINAATLNGCLIDTLGLTATVRTAALNNIWLNAHESEPDLTGGIGNVRFSQWAPGNPRWVENKGGVFASDIGWGVRTTASAAANVLGSVTRKVSVWDEGGNVLGYVPVYDAINAGPEDDYLLASGTVTGATSQAQTFTNGIIGPTWKPASDSTTALKMTDTSGTAVVTVDTTNGRVGIGSTPTAILEVSPEVTSASTVYGLQSNVRNNGTGDMYGLRTIQLSYHTGTRIKATGIETGIWQVTSGTISDAVCIDATGLLLLDGIVGTLYGLRISGIAGASLANYAIHADSGTVYLAGSTGLGVSSPDSKLHVQLDDAATNAASQLLTLSHNTSGTAAAGFGSRVLWELESSTTADQSAAALDVTWTTATHATRTSKAALSLVNSAAALAEVISFAPTEVVVNDAGNATTDFRAETDTEANMLLVDASADLLYLGGTTNGIKIAKGGDLTLLGTAVYERHVQIPVTHVGATANQPTPVDVFTAGGDQYPTTGAKYGFLQWEVPDDWDGTDIVMEIDWLPDSGAISGTSAVRWTVEYRSIAEGETINNGTSVTLDNGAGGDTADYSQYQTKHTRFTLAYNDANQPIAKQDHIYFKISRDTGVANDFSGSVVVTAYEIIYNSTGFPTSN